MKFFYRDGDDVFCGDLMYIPVEGGKRLHFDDKGHPRKIISLLNPTIAEIGMARMIVECEGITYRFYTDADWITTVYKVAGWARSDYPPQEVEDFVDVVDLIIKSE